MTHSDASGSGEQPRSQVQASRLIATFTDYDNHFAPYEGRALRVSLADDVLFLYIGKLTEERGVEKLEWDEDHGIGVDVETLYETLGAMIRREDRESFDRLREGSLTANHSTLRLEQATVPSYAIRRRA